MKPLVSWISLISILYVSMFLPVAQIRAECTAEQRDQYMEDTAGNQAPSDSDQDVLETSQNLTDSDCLDDNENMEEFEDALDWSEGVYMFLFSTAIILFALSFSIKCPKQADPWVAFGSAIIFMVWECINWMVFSDYLEMEKRELWAMTNVRTEEARTMQVKALLKARDEINEAANAVEKRSYSYLAHMIGLFAAALTAFIIYIVYAASSSGTKADEETRCVAEGKGKGQCPGPEDGKPAYIPTKQDLHYAQKKLLDEQPIFRKLLYGLIERTVLPQILNKKQLHAYYHPSDEAWKRAYAKLEYQRLQQGAVSSQSIDHYNSLAEYDPNAAPVEKSEKSLMEKLSSATNDLFFVPDAYANTEETVFGVIGIVAAVAAVIILIYVATAGPICALAKLSGLWRGVIWAVLGALQLTTWQMVVSKQERLEAQAKLYSDLADKIQTRMGTSTNSNGSNTSITGGTVDASGIIDSPFANNQGSGTPDECPSVKGSGTVTTGECPGTSKLQRPPFTKTVWPNINSSGAAGAINNTVASVKDATNTGTLTPENTAWANSDNMNAMRKKARNMMKKINDQQAKAGKDKTPFAKAMRKITRKITKAARKGLAEAKSSMPAISMADIGGGTGGKSGGATKKASKMLAAYNKGGMDALESGDGDEMIDWGDDEDEAKEGEIAGDEDFEETDAAAALAGLDLKDNDINNNSGTDIFVQITRRYRSTAYPIFFKKGRKKAAAAEAARRAKLRKKKK
jgi:hypothetical protein